MAIDPETGRPGFGPGPDGPAEHPAALALTGALQGLYRAFQKLAMYPAGHPSVPEAIDVAAERFTAAIAGRNWVVVRVTRHDLYRDDQRISSTSETLRALAGVLHGLDLAALEFRNGIRQRELETFVHLLADARRDAVTGAALVEALERSQVESIRLCAIDYRALQIEIGVQRESGNSSNLWDHLSVMLTDPETFPSAKPVQELADDVLEQVQSLEGTGVSELRTELHRQIRRSDNLASGQTQVVRRKMGDFVAALNPDLRRNLLQVGTARTRESLALMNDLSDSIPPREILEALENVDRFGGEAHHELVQLLQKLVRISRDRPAVRDQLEDTLSRWGVSSNVLRDPGRLGEAVEEVFQRRNRTDYNPNEYRGLLGELTSGELTGAIPESARLYGDPSNPDAVKSHGAEIAVRLLGLNDGDEFRPALFGFVGTHADRLLKRGNLAAVVHATVAARADRVLKRDGEDITRAAEGFLEDFKDEKRIDLILDGSPESEPLSLEARGLLALGGALALDRVLERLGRDLDPLRADSMMQFCASRDAQAWEPVLERRASEGWTSLEPVFPVLRRMSLEASGSMLRTLFEHESSRVRREALISLCEIDPESCHRHIERGLADESLRVVNTSLRRLASDASPEALTLLEAYATGETPGSWFSPDAFNLSLQLLISLGLPGVEAVCRCLDRSRSRLRPLDARRGRRMAEVLAPWRDESARARTALTRWRRSPARLLGLALPKLGPTRGNR